GRIVRATSRPWTLGGKSATRTPRSPEARYSGPEQPSAKRPTPTSKTNALPWQRSASGDQLFNGVRPCLFELLSKGKKLLSEVAQLCLEFRDLFFDSFQSRSVHS